MSKNKAESIRGSMDIPNTYNRTFFISVSITFLVIIFFHLFSALSGYPIYRDQHLGTALEFAKGRIDIFKPIIVGFNATSTPTPQELPLWQAMAGLAFKIFGTWFGWANIVSLLIFATALWPLYSLARDYLDEKTARWSILFFLWQPLIILKAGEAGVDGMCLALSLWLLYFLGKAILKWNFTSWLIAFLIGPLVAVSKLPFFLVVGLTGIFLLLASKQKEKIINWVFLIAVGLFSLLIFIIWTRYTDHCISLAEFPLVDLRMTHNNRMWWWYFGDWSYRFSLFPWVRGGWRILNSLFGSFAFLALTLTALFTLRNYLGKILLLSASVALIIFSHLFLEHFHYYLIFSPAVALLSGQAMALLEERLELRKLKKYLAFHVLVLLALLFSAIQGLMSLEIVLNYDRYPKKITKLIEKYTKPSDKLIIQGGGWGGEQLFLSKRKGLSISTTQVLEDEKNLIRLKSLGFNKLVMISESPLLNALQVTNPGNSERRRQLYQDSITPKEGEWEKVYQDTDILVKELP